MVIAGSPAMTKTKWPKATVGVDTYRCLWSVLWTSTTTSLQRCYRSVCHQFSSHVAVVANSGTRCPSSSGVPCHRQWYRKPEDEGRRSNSLHYQFFTTRWRSRVASRTRLYRFCPRVPERRVARPRARHPDTMTGCFVKIESHAPVM